MSTATVTLPSRAKAVLLTPVLFVYGMLLGVIAAVTGGLTAGQWADWHIAAFAVDLLSIGFYLTMAGLFVLGLAWIIRSTAGTLTAAFLLLLLVPLMLSESELRPLVWLAALLPGGAGQNYLTGSTDPINPSLSAAVLVAWAVAALFAGSRVLSRRDA